MCYNIIKTRFSLKAYKTESKLQKDGRFIARIILHRSETYSINFAHFYALQILQPLNCISQEPKKNTFKVFFLCVQLQNSRDSFSLFSLSVKHAKQYQFKFNEQKKGICFFQTKQEKDPCQKERLAFESTQKQSTVF